MNKKDIKENRKSRRSQIEMFGLAFIILLVVIGFFLYFQFMVITPKDKPLQGYIDSQTAANFVYSLTTVNVEECSRHKYSIQDLLVFCAYGESVDCTYTDPCKLANNTITSILSKSLVRQNFAFRLFTENLEWDAGGNIDISNYKCDSNTERVRGSQPIALYPRPGTVYLNLYICKQ